MTKLKSYPPLYSNKQKMKRTFLITAAALVLGSFGLEQTLVASPIAQQTQDQISNPNDTNDTQVKLLNPGAEPREQLRFKVQPKQSQTTKISMKINVDTKLNGQPVPRVNTPAINLIMDVEVTKVEENGDVYANFIYSDIEVAPDSETSPEVLSAVNAKIQQIKGLKGSIVFDNRGLTKTYQIYFPESADADLKKSLESTLNSLETTSNPLPLEAVGTGAQWEVTSVINSGGINLKQIATYSLLEVKDEQVALDLVVQQQGNQQPIESSNLPPDVTATLQSYQSKGQGKILLNLNQTMPVIAELETTSTGISKLKQSGNPQDFLVNSDSTINLKIQSR